MDSFLNSVLRGLINYSTGIYVLLVLGILIYLRKFLMGFRDWQKSVFGLEQDFAQRKLTSASTGLILLILLVIGQFILVTIIGPQMPVQSLGATTTIDPLASPTATLSPGDAQIAEQIPSPVTMRESLVSECIEGILEITTPTEGEAVSGTVDIIGSVNIENFGSYKYEYSTTGNINWITVAAGNQLKLDESLGLWYTSALTPGTYLLQLVPLNNVGEELTPCIITVDVVLEE